MTDPLDSPQAADEALWQWALLSFDKTIETLEALRRQVCAYGPHAVTCDCKYANVGTHDKPLGSDGETTGCPELREAINALRMGPRVRALLGEVERLQGDVERLRSRLNDLAESSAHAARTLERCKTGMQPPTDDTINAVVTACMTRVRDARAARAPERLPSPSPQSARCSICGYDDLVAHHLTRAVKGYHPFVASTDTTKEGSEHGAGRRALAKYREVAG